MQVKTRNPFTGRAPSRFYLLIDGARRVGKSYIAAAFAEQEYKSHIIIDFCNAPQDIPDFFVNDSADSASAALYGDVFADLSLYFS